MESIDLDVLAGTIVEAVLSDLSDRAGVGDELDQVEPDIMEMMVGELNDIVVNILKRTGV